MPVKVPTTDNTAEYNTTDLKLYITLIAESAGNTRSAVMSREPTRFIASTIITAIITARARLYAPAFFPIALVKLSSNVTANILL